MRRWREVRRLEADDWEHLRNLPDRRSQTVKVDLQNIVEDDGCYCKPSQYRRQDDNQDDGAAPTFSFLWAMTIPSMLRISMAKTGQVPMGTLPHLQHNLAKTKDIARKVPRPIVVIVCINGRDMRALLDSGSLGDFMLSALADQLGLLQEKLKKPITVQLAVQGSRTKVNYGANVDFEYASIKSKHWFDVINVDGYDIILGTPFMYQHRVELGFNDTQLVIGSDTPLPMKQGAEVTVLSSRAMDILEGELDKVRAELKAYAAPLCKKAAETELPPLHEVNHRIPLIDPGKALPFWPSKCPEAFRSLWAEKQDHYLNAGRWRFATGANTAPMMFLKKHGKPGDPLRMRTVIDLRARNANTHKLASPLPDMRAVLYRVSAHHYVSLMDGQDAYEQF
jgi:hypothetical protein